MRETHSELPAPIAAIRISFCMRCSWVGAKMSCGKRFAKLPVRSESLRWGRRKEGDARAWRTHPMTSIAMPRRRSGRFHFVCAAVFGEQYGKRSAEHVNAGGGKR